MNQGMICLSYWFSFRDIVAHLAPSRLVSVPEPFCSWLREMFTVPATGRDVLTFLFLAVRDIYCTCLRQRYVNLSVSGRERC